MKELDNFYLNQEEPIKSCMMALRDIIVSYHPEIVPEWKYRLPCFTYNKKIFCYLWIDKKTKFPYISMNKGVHLNHPQLILGNRKVFKLLLIDPEEDFPLEVIHEIFDEAIKLY